MTAARAGGDTPSPTISIVTPAFNESRGIADSLGKLREFLRTTPQSFEILVVNDGSTDGTGAIVRRFERDGVRLVNHDARRGKGHSVRTGMLKATGTYVLFTDADFSTPIDELLKLFDIAERDGEDIVIGSRAIDRRSIERHQSKFRETSGILFNRLVRAGLGLRCTFPRCSSSPCWFARRFPATSARF